MNEEVTEIHERELEHMGKGNPEEDK